MKGVGRWLLVLVLLATTALTTSADETAAAAVEETRKVVNAAVMTVVEAPNPVALENKVATVGTTTTIGQEDEQAKRQDAITSSAVEAPSVAAEVLDAKSATQVEGQAAGAAVVAAMDAQDTARVELEDQAHADAAMDGKHVDFTIPWNESALVLAAGGVVIVILVVAFRRRRNIVKQRDEQDQMLQSLLYSDLDYAAM